MNEKNIYNVIVDSKEGFKVKFEATDPKILEMFKELTKVLYEKIEKIKIEIGGNNEEY